MCSFGTLTVLFCSLSINIGLTAPEQITISPSCGASSCVTLAQYSPSTSDNITLSLLPGDHVISSTLRFEQKGSVTLQGHDPSASRPVIRCSGQGLVFVRINMFHFQYVTIVNCSVVVECATNPPDTSRVRMSYLMLTAINRPILKINSCAYVNISYSAFQGQASSRSHSIMLHFSRIGNLGITYCNFTDIVARSSHGSVMAFDEIHQLHLFQCNIENIRGGRFGSVIRAMADRVQFLHCSIRNITMGGFGSVVRLQNASIEFSTFDSNFVNDFGSLVSMSGNARIEFSTFDSNFVNEFSSLVSMSGNARYDDHGCLVSKSDSIALTGCSTFSNNVIERFGSLMNANPSFCTYNELDIYTQQYKSAWSFF